MKKKIISAILIGVFSLSTQAYPCTTFVLRDDNAILFGRNLDWCAGMGLLIVNPKNLQKMAMGGPVEEPPGNPAKWVSKYASVTFNQVGREYPFGGINEAGLVVEQMTLPETVYPPADDRSAISECQWIQYQLDNCSTVREVIGTDRIIRISDAVSPLHFLVCDKRGDAAVIEFLGGKMVYHTGDDLSVPALANSTYEEALNSCGIEPNEISYRFIAAAEMIDACREAGGMSVDYAFDILSKVSQGYGTKWSVVYDITNMRIYFKVFETPKIVGEQKIFLKPMGTAEIKYIDLNQIDFNALKTARVVDLEIEQTGCINSCLVDYTTEINRQMVFKTMYYYRNYGVPIDINTISDEALNELSKYPESLISVSKN